MVVEVFKTNIQNKTQAKAIVNILKNEFPKYKINIDLEDCDKVLRVECDHNIVAVESILNLVQNYNINIEILID